MSDLASTPFLEILAFTAVAGTTLGVVVYLLERWQERRALRRRIRPTQTIYRRQPWN